MWATRPCFTFAVHPHLQTLEQAAVLAPVPLLAGHLAVLVPAAAVDALVADAALEEALAALAGNDAIVQACGPIPADEAGPLVRRIICRSETTHTVTHTSGWERGATRAEQEVQKRPEPPSGDPGRGSLRRTLEPQHF